MQRALLLPLHSRRHGIAILSAIVCVVVLSAVAASLLRSVLTRSRESDRQAHQLQADALAQSALERGFLRHAADPAYRGEVWTPDVAGATRMKAEIEWIETPMGGTLRVVCLVPADSDQPVRLERTASIPTPPPAKVE